MRKGKVLHILTNLELGGAQTSVVDICSGLCKRGHCVEMAYSSKGGWNQGGHSFLLGRLLDSGVPVHDLQSMRRDIRPLSDFRAYRQLRELIRESRPEIVHTHTSKAGILGRLAAAAENVPHVVHTVRGWSFYKASSRPTRLVFTALERWAARRTETMVAVCPTLVEDGCRAGMRSTRYIVVYSGIDLKRFGANGTDSNVLRREVGIPPGVPVVGSVMGLYEAKAPLDFVAAAARISQSAPTTHFLVVGDGPSERAMRQSAARLKLSDRLHLVGARLDVPQMLRLMEVFLLTSHWEGMPRSVVEAMAANVPVVATSVGGTLELVAHGESGFLAAPGDTDSLAEYVLTLIRDRSLASEFATRARHKVLPEFDLAATLDRHEELYDELLANAATTPRGKK